MYLRCEDRLTQLVDETVTTYRYNGDGGRVTLTTGCTTTAYIGNYFEWAGSAATSTSYYYAGGTRVAMWTGPVSGGAIYYLLSDHLGSTAITLDSAGNRLKTNIELRSRGRTTRRSRIHGFSRRPPCIRAVRVRHPVNPPSLAPRRLPCCRGFRVSSLAGAMIQSASLTLYVTSRSNSNSLTAAVYPVLRAWHASYATWARADCSVAWTAAGCNGVGTDRSGTAAASVTFAIASGYVTTPNLTALVQG